MKQDLKKQLDHSTSLLQSLQKDTTDDDSITLADGPQLPMATDDYMKAEEPVLENKEYRKR